MAKVDGNDLTLGLRGKFGDQFVFRKSGKMTVATKRSAPTGAPTEKQVLQRERFRMATLYARRCMLHPELKADYEAISSAANMGAFAAAVRDYLKPIAISEIALNGYNGEADWPIGIVVNDVLKVKTLKVTITDVSGSILESGEATRSGSSSGHTYVTTVPIPDVSGVTIRVEAKDRPGNSTSSEVTL